MRNTMIATVVAGALVAGGAAAALAHGMSGQMPMSGYGQQRMQGQADCPMMDMMGPGMMGGGMMGPGMMGRGMMGPGMMGPGMMGGGMMGPGTMDPGTMDPGTMGPGMMGQGMMGQGMMGQGMMGGGMMRGMGQGRGMMQGLHPMFGMDGMHPLARDLSVEDVTHIMTHRLEWMGNPNLKLGEVVARDDDVITAKIVTTEGSLVWELEFDRHTGMFRPSGG